MKALKEGISDEELFRFSEKGNRQAFEHLYDRYFNKLIWFAQGFLKDRDAAQDLVQDVFIKIIEKPGLFDSTKKFSTWIYTVTANQCRNTLRNEQNRTRILRDNFDAEGIAGETSNYDSKLLERELQNAIEQLNDKERNIYSLRFEEHMSIKEIAQVIAIPEGTVKSGIFHLLKKVSKHLKAFTHAK